MTDSNDTSLVLLEETEPQLYSKRTRYFIEVDYPGYDEDGPWQSSHSHSTPEAAAAQWRDRDPVSPYPCRIIEEVVTTTQRVVGEMQ